MFQAMIILEGGEYEWTVFMVGWGEIKRYSCAWLDY